MRNVSMRWVGILAGAIALAAATPALGQEERVGERHRHDPEKQVERLREALDLTDDQVAEVRAILDEQSEKHRELKESEDREGFRALRQETHDRLATVLDEAQREKLESLKQEHRGEGHERGHEEDRHRERQEAEG